MSQQSSSTSAKIRSNLNDFKFVKEIGKGSYGTVFQVIRKRKLKIKHESRNRINNESLNPNKTQKKKKKILRIPAFSHLKKTTGGLM